MVGPAVHIVIEEILLISNVFTFTGEKIIENFSWDKVLRDQENGIKMRLGI